MRNNEKCKRNIMSGIIRILGLCLLIACVSICCKTDTSAKLKKITAAKSRNKAGTIKKSVEYKVNVKGNKGGLTFVAPEDGDYWFFVDQLRSNGVKKSKDQAEMVFYLSSRNNLKKTKKSKNGLTYYTPFRKVYYYDETRNKNTYVHIGTETTYLKEVQQGVSDKKRTPYNAIGKIKLKKDEAYILVAEAYGINVKKGFSFTLEVLDD